MFCAKESRAQIADSLLSEYQVLAQFSRAQSVASDPSGTIYVVDADDSTISTFTKEGLFLESFGGPGIGNYEFDEPLDIDPTNGLLIFVADAGNGEIRKYSGEFLHLQTISTQLAEARKGDTFGERRDDQELNSGTEEGRPIGVAAAESGELFALDADRGEVLKWNSSKRLERSFGGIDTMGESLSEPVSLTLGKDGHVYVADRADKSVFVYDWFGNYIKKIYEGLAVDIQAVTTVEDYVVLVLPKHLLFFNQQGRLIRTFEIGIEDDIVDMTARDGALYILTEARLLRFPWTS